VDKTTVGFDRSSILSNHFEYSPITTGLFNSRLQVQSINVNTRLSQFVFTSSLQYKGLKERRAMGNFPSFPDDDLTVLSKDQDKVSSHKHDANIGQNTTSKHTSPEDNTTKTVLRTYTYNHGFGDSGFNRQLDMKHWLSYLDNKSFIFGTDYH
jgi:hypothetical protein